MSAAGEFKRRPRHLGGERLRGIPLPGPIGRAIGWTGPGGDLAPIMLLDLGVQLIVPQDGFGFRLSRMLTSAAIVGANNENGACANV